jgi:transcription initiation factor TFIIB
MTGTEQVAASSPEQCPECGGPISTSDREAVCGACGLIVDEHFIDHGPDWRNFDDGPDRRRTQALSILRHDSNLGTDQTRGLTDAQVTEKIASESVISSQRIYTRQEAYRIAAALGWDWSHKERAGDIVGQLYAETTLIGRDADTVAAAICWLVARVFEMGHSPGDVAAPARDVDSDKMLRQAQWVKRTLDLPVPVADYETRCRRIGATLDLNQPTIEAAVERVRDLDGMDKSGAKPSSLAAAALYIESDETQATVADAAGVTPPTIRNQFDRFGFSGAYHG